jgi:hypothetical protein
MLPHCQHGRKAIETWGQQAATTSVGPTVLDAALRQAFPGTAGIRVIQRINAPKNLKTASAESKYLNEHLKSFTKDYGLHRFFTFHCSTRPLPRLPVL